MGWTETAAFGYLRERLIGTAGPHGTFGYPATCAVSLRGATVSGVLIRSGRVRSSSKSGSHRCRSLTAPACFKGTAGRSCPRPPRSAGAQPPPHSAAVSQGNHQVRKIRADIMKRQRLMLSPASQAGRLRRCNDNGADLWAPRLRRRRFDGFRFERSPLHRCGLDLF
jgi:hypothetical protein